MLGQPVPTAAASASRKRHTPLWEWLGLSAALVAVTLWLATPGYLSHPQTWLQDMTRALQHVPPSPQVVVVAVDEHSLANIGRWPWRRALHAQLIRQIDAGQPQSIGMDIVFAEEDWDYPADDWLLAQTMAASGRVVLPVLRTQGATPGVLLPLEPLRQAAAALGHVQLPLDADGGIRSFYAHEGPAGATWPHLGLAMACLATPTAPACTKPSTRAPSNFAANSATNSAANTATSAAASAWERHSLAQLAWAQGQPAFTTYSYIDVLQGRIPASAFRHKHVLIGVVATGLGTPLTVPGTAAKTTTNVELTAHVLSGHLQQQHAQLLGATASRALNAAPVLVALAGLAVLGPSAGLLLCVGLALLMLVAASVAPGLWQVAFNPSAAIVVLLLAYPLWSWRRLNAAARFLNQAMQGLQGQGMGIHTGPRRLARGDFLQHRIDAVEQASHQLRQLHQLVTQTLLQLPSPTLACDAHDRIVLANSAAHHYAASLGRRLQAGDPVAPLLEGAIERGTLAPLWPATQPPPSDTPWQREGMDAQQRSLLLLSQPFAVGHDHGRLLSLVDISELREALAQRDQAMHFISHDIRAPIGAILTVIEMQQHWGTTGQTASNTAVDQDADLLPRIARYAHSALALADDFVHLARAQHHTPSTMARQPVELGAVMDQALDDTWAAAQQRGVELAWMPQATEAWVQGDASMLRRACMNLLSNAIKYGPAHSTVHCSLYADDGAWCMAIRDEGNGISAEEQARLFAPFRRQQQHEGGHIPGIGLGLAYVHTTALLHGGSVQVISTPGAGAQFVLRLPQAQPPEAGDANS